MVRILPDSQWERNQWGMKWESPQKFNLPKKNSEFRIRCPLSVELRMLGWFIESLAFSVGCNVQRQTSVSHEIHTLTTCLPPCGFIRIQNKAPLTISLHKSSLKWINTSSAHSFNEMFLSSVSGHCDVYLTPRNTPFHLHANSNLDIVSKYLVTNLKKRILPFSRCYIR